MTKKRSTRKIGKSRKKRDTIEASAANATVDGVRLGEEVAPGLTLRSICRGHGGTIGRIAWSPCGRFLASPSEDRTVRIWRASDGESVCILEGHTEHVHCVAWAPSAPLLASVDNKSRLRLWDIADILDEKATYSISVSEYHEHTSGECYSVAWSSDGKFLATASRDELLIWDALGWSVRHRIETQHVGNLELCWSPDGTLLASASGGPPWEYDNSIQLWDPITGKAVVTIEADVHPTYAIAWLSGGTELVSDHQDSNIAVWDIAAERQVARLESHTSGVMSLSVSSDGLLMASKSGDGTVRIWRCDAWATVAVIKESASDTWIHGLAFNPVQRKLATLGENDKVIRIWDYDTPSLLEVEPNYNFVSYTSAKVVLVGDSNVGKSCLAMRIAEDRYPHGAEHGTTHGMRLWTTEAEKLHAAAKPPTGHRRDVVIWDFGGQDEYQLMHQMFLHDTTLAIILIDPTRGQKSLDEAREWNNRLEKHFCNRPAAKLLVGAQIDDEKKSSLINRGAVQTLCDECGFVGFYETSSLNGRGIVQFRQALASALDWEGLSESSRPELFQAIRDEIEMRRRRGEVVLLFDEFDLYLQTNEECGACSLLHHEVALMSSADAGTDALRAVCSQMSLQGMLVRTKLSGGDDAIILQLPAIERYAASLIIAARDNPRGVPALETIELGSPGISLPGMGTDDRVSRGQERILLEAVTELMIKHGLCFRHEGLLIFPTLLKTTETTRVDVLRSSISLYYEFSGAIDNIYASLISWLVIGQGFGRIRLWENRVEFDAEGRGVCGLRKVNRGGGFAHLDVYFHEATDADIQSEFISFVHGHLRSSGIAVVEHFRLTCSNKECGYEFPRDVIQNRVVKGHNDVACPQCETRINLSEGISQQGGRDKRADRKSFALMTRVREDVPKIVANVKVQAFGRADNEYVDDRPIRILHLSDLHFTSSTLPETKLQWLDDDIKKGGWLSSSDLDYVVISGDMTRQGSMEGFQRAAAFVSLLIERFGLSAERCVFVPGNHDVQDLDDVYEWRMKIGEGAKKRAVKQGELFGLPNERYNDRLKAFSDQFYHLLLQKPYPLEPVNQGVPYIFPETRLQFWTLNSCWEIDQFHRTRASIHPDAVARLIADADKQIGQISMSMDVSAADFLRIGVWHHPVADVERGIRNREFLGNLQTNRVRICLTGDVHEMRRELIDHWHQNRMHVLGAGSFGSREEELSEGSPRLYNLLEIDREFRSIRVHTRQQPKPDGPWRGWNDWPMPDGGDGGLPYFDIALK